MASSMTGAAVTNWKTKSFQMNFFLKSTNNRFFDCFFKAPPAFQIYERSLISIVQKYRLRGRIDIEVEVSASTESPALNQDLFTKYREIFKSMDVDIRQTPFWDLPGMLTLKPSLPDGFSESEFYHQFEKAVGKLHRSCNKEAKALEKLIKGYLADLRKKTKVIYSLCRKHSTEEMKKFQSELMEWSSDSPANRDHAILQWLDRSNIVEEIERLLIHIRSTEELLSQDLCSKEIDFFLQEINREVNTIGSKSRHAEIRRLVVDMKTTSEKMKEQVRNLC